jgi:hypothetical protein
MRAILRHITYQETDKSITLHKEEHEFFNFHQVLLKSNKK